MLKDSVYKVLDKIDPEMGMFIEIDENQIYSKLKQLTALGRLSDTFIAVKDLIDTANLRTTRGSQIFYDHVPDENATIVDLLENAGAIVIGKTNLDEFAYGVGGYNPHYGAILNPRDKSRTAGGSSGGSAAVVAAGICPIAVGTDTSGSVRIPAACCGVYGINLAPNALPMRGVWPLAHTYDSIGYFAADISDLQRVLDVNELPEVKNIKIGHIGVNVEIPVFPIDDHFTNFRHDTWDIHQELFSLHSAEYGKNVFHELEIVSTLSDTLDSDTRIAREHLKLWRNSFCDAVRGFDVIMCPVFDGQAPILEAVMNDYENDEFFHGDRLMRVTPMFNELGWPAMSVPTEQGAVQIATRPGGEAFLLAIGKEIGLARDEVIVKN